MAHKTTQSNKKWTETDYNAVKYFVSKYGTEIGFKKAAIDLDRTVKAISIKYYQCINPGSSNKIHESKYDNLDKKAVAKTLNSYIAKDPTSITGALKKTANEFNMPVGTLTCMYYGAGKYSQNKESNPIYKGNMTSCYLISNQVAIRNGKNPTRNKKNQYVKESHNWLFSLITRLLKSDK